MKFEFKPRSREDTRNNNQWSNILRQRRLLAAAESSSSAATGRGQPDIRHLADPALALVERQTSEYGPKYETSKPTY